LLKNSGLGLKIKLVKLTKVKLTYQFSINEYYYYYYYFCTPGSKDPGGETKTKNKLEWLRVGVVLSRERFVKEDRIEPLNQDTDPLK